MFPNSITFYDIVIGLKSVATLHTRIQHVNIVTMQFMWNTLSGVYINRIYIANDIYKSGRLLY